MAIRQLWPRLDLRQAGPMVAGGVLGVPLGVWLLPLVDAASFRLGVGVLLCLYCPALLLLRRIPHMRGGGRAADVAVGVVGGAMGGLAGLSGPAPVLWSALRGWDKDRQRATVQSFLLVAQLAALVGFGLAGMLGPRVLHLAAWTIPCVLLPSWLGTRAYARLGGEAFRRLVLLLLLATGAVLVMQGLPAVLAR
jgi:uncharacterized protein